MEKIYMEENKQRKRKGLFSYKKLVGLSLIVVVVVATIVATTFDRSYAIPDVSYVLPDTFTTKDVDSQLHSDTGFSVFPYYASDGTQVFCLEHKVNFQGNTEYHKDEAITDYGLLYLMAHIYPNVKNDNLNINLQTWISQVAVWMYLYRVDDYKDDGQLNRSLVSPCADDSADVCEIDLTIPHSSLNYISSEEFTAIESARGVNVDDDLTYYTLNGEEQGIITSNPPLLTTIVNNLVDEAWVNRSAPNKNLDLNFSNKVAVTSDNKYYQTSEVSVIGSPSDNFNGYKLEIKKAPEGTFVVDANGNEISDLTSLTPANKLYFRIPIDKVTEENKTIAFEVTGSFKTYEGNYYKAAGAQTITSVQSVNNNISKGAEIPLNYTPPVPDTGMNTAQTIYFIGLIILLSGVGIIYANVKPKEEN